MIRKEDGPPIYEHWKAALEGHPAFFGHEFPLFTDADIISEVRESCGPYKLLNTVPWNAEYQVLRPAIVLRVEYHKKYDLTHAIEQTNDQRYHGGALQDEIAALISLCLGIRLKAGGATRRFDLDGDPRGNPEAFESHRDPILPKGFRGVIVPRAVGVHSLDAAAPLSSFPLLSTIDAIALIRAARLYQDALWIAEAQPELAWLLFVSAIEAAAGHWRSSNETPIERLRASRPHLEELLRKVGDDEFILQVAAELAPYMGATKKFVDFILTFLPDPPKERPVEFVQHPWNQQAIKQSMSLIYKYRSRALHGGTPFPAPMCEPPRKFGDNGILSETPIPGGMSTLGGAWLTKDMPMLLHTFEYIVREALLFWWKSMVQ